MLNYFCNMRILIFTILLIFSAQPSLIAQKQITVVIDPGHGGKDPGHESKSANLLSEKELNLKIALYLGSYIEKYLQNIKVVYTRTTDVYPTLDERVAKANSIKADYFISIHCNGNANTKVRGTETHVHSLATKKSVELAKDIEAQFAQRAGRSSRGIKDANDRAHSIQVLKYTQMASVLIECGFLTNPAEANYLNTSNGQEIIASAIFRGFRSHIEKVHPAINFRKPTTVTQESGAYVIQLMSSKEPFSPTSSHFKKMPASVTRIQINTTNAYKYIYHMGSYTSKNDAQKDLKIAQANGYKDAFVTKKN